MNGLFLLGTYMYILYESAQPYIMRECKFFFVKERVQGINVFVEKRGSEDYIR